MIRTPGLIITVLVAVCLILQVYICDAAQLYLTRDMYSRLPVLDDGITVQWVKEEEGASGGEQGRKIFDLWMWRAGRESAVMPLMRGWSP